VRDVSSFSWYSGIIPADATVRKIAATVPSLQVTMVCILQPPFATASRHTFVKSAVSPHT
jgi:hypothetical protein